MITISLCMIVKNEEQVLGRCLESVKAAVDEIILVDTGSTDRTKEIGAEFGAQLYDFEWIDDFSAARNASFSKATKDYILWLDADDVLSPSDQKKLLALKESLDPAVTVVMMKYHTAFHADGTPSFTYYRERLIKNHMGYRWDGEIHEAITPSGNILYSDISVMHKKAGPGDPERNLRIFEGMRKSGKQLSPRHRFYYARELFYHARYQEAIAEFTAFLDSKQGWIENCIDACKLLSYCYASLGDRENQLRALLRSLEYDLPRAELCCEVGQYFMEFSRYKEAIFWYEIAVSREKNEKSGAFIQPDCYDYIPYLQLCVCWDRMGDHEKAASYNELAGAIKPNSEAVAYNRNYFQSLFSTAEEMREE